MNTFEQNEINRANCNAGINADPNVSVCSVVRGHQFRRGVIKGYARVSGFPLVKFDGEDEAFAVHPAQLISEMTYVRITAGRA